MYVNLYGQVTILTLTLTFYVTNHPELDPSHYSYCKANPHLHPSYLPKPWLSQYIGKILYDFETRATAKLFRVVSIQFVRSYTSTRHSCWEATCEPVLRDPATGDFRVPKDVQVPGSNVTLTHALQGYCLAEYTNGLDAEPSYLPWVQEYVDHFRNVILPKLPSPMLYTPPVDNDLPSPKKDLPSSRNKRKTSATQDLPSSRRTRPRRTTQFPVKTAQQVVHPFPNPFCFGQHHLDDAVVQFYPRFFHPWATESCGPCMKKAKVKLANYIVNMV